MCAYLKRSLKHYFRQTLFIIVCIFMAGIYYRSQSPWQWVSKDLKLKEISGNNRKLSQTLRNFWKLSETFKKFGNFGNLLKQKSFGNFGNFQSFVVLLYTRFSGSCNWSVSLQAVGIFTLQTLSAWKVFVANAVLELHLHIFK